MKDDLNEKNIIPTLYFPDGKTVPLVLTEEELITLLRLDQDGPKHPKSTLEYYREKGLLKGLKIGKNLRYYLPDVIRFLAEQSGWSNRKNIS